MGIVAAILILSLAAAGCASKSESQQQAAFLAGQNALLRQQQQQPTVTVVGPVQNSRVPWVVGLTLAQAIATANYLDAHPPKAVTITHDGETATLAAAPFSSIADVPLDAGDVVQIQPQE